MAVFLVLFPAILLSLLSLSDTPQKQQQNNNRLVGELQELKLKVAQLEAVLEESIQSIDAKSIYLKERQKLIEEMENKIHDLQSALLSIESDSLLADERLSALEEEVRLLWAASRKNNFDLHILESKAQDAEDRLEAVTSEVEKMEDIVTEQWIQIQQHEQALHIAEMRAFKALRQVRSTRGTFLKFINDLSGKHLPKLLGMLDSYLFGKGSSLSSYVSHTVEQLKIVFSAVRKYHHELQGFIRQEMERYEFTAALANSEVVFFVASALITFPILSAWMLLSSQFS